MGKLLQKLLLNPIFVLSILGLSIVMGLTQPDAVKNLDFIGVYYISLLKMIVLPYLFVTITTGVAKMASDPNAKLYTWRLITTYPLAMAFSATLAVGACFVVAPVGDVDQAAIAELGGLLSNGEVEAVEQGAVVTFSGAEVEAEHVKEHGLFDRFVPDNIFAALSSGDSLKVVIFCTIFGAALARHNDEGTRTVLDVFNVVKLACITVILWLNLLLPFALFAMVASQVANVGVGPLISLGPFVVVQAATGLTLLAISALIISNRARVSPIAAITKLHETIILAITTRSSFACIPIAVRELTEKLKLDRSGTDLVMPLGTTICRIGAVPYFAIGTIFIAEVYGVELTWLSYVMIILGSVAAGFASSGATGAMGVVLISIVAGPLNLPVEAAIALFIAVDPILDVIRTLVLVYGNCALTSIIIPRGKVREEPTSAEAAPLLGAGR
jgi:proton glutamate symport protein